MDPNANLQEQLELASQFLSQADQDEATRSEFVPIDEVARLAELVVSLDEWLNRKGFLPQRWQR